MSHITVPAFNSLGAPAPDSSSRLVQTLGLPASHGETWIGSASRCECLGSESADGSMLLSLSLLLRDLRMLVLYMFLYRIPQGAGMVAYG